MSKQRAAARAERERAAAERSDQVRRGQHSAAARRRRAERRAATWRRLRLWRGGSRQHREIWASVVPLAIVTLLSAYLVTRSIGALVLALLVFLIAAPAVVSLLARRR